MYFSTLKSNMLFELLPLPRVFFLWQNLSLNYNFSEFSFSLCYQYVVNMAEALYYILNIVWTRKLNHNKDSRHVSPITDSQTVQAQTRTDTLVHETNRKFCLRNTALLVVCRSYECGELTFISQRQNFTPLVKKCYELYFGREVGDQDKSWALHICCLTLVRLQTGLVNCSRQIPFAVLTVWKGPKDNSSDCCSYLTL